MRMIAVILGPEILAFRHRLGMTPTEFAARVGVSASVVSYWERGLRVPKVGSLIKMNDLALERAIDIKEFDLHGKGNDHRKARKPEPVA